MRSYDKRTILSIIVPVYNASLFLEECLKSILSNEFCFFELLLIDDGSQDFSLRICKKYARADQRVSVFHKENGGVSSARNKGIELAKGRYIWFIDADDYIDFEFLEDFYNASLFNPKADVFLFGHKKVRRNGEVISNSIQNESSTVASLGVDELNGLLTSGIGLSCWDKIVKTTIVKRVNGFQDRTNAEDYIFSLDVYKVSLSIMFISRSPYAYRVHISDRRKNNLQLLENHIEAYNKLCSFLYAKSAGQKNNREVKSYFFRKWFVYVTPINVMGFTLSFSDKYSYLKRVREFYEKTKESILLDPFSRFLMHEPWFLVFMGLVLRNVRKLYLNR